VAGLAAWTACGLDLDAALAQLMDARGLAADMRLQLHRSAGAAQRAVMAETDDASAEFAREAEEAARALEQDLGSIGPILEQLRYTDEMRLAREFGESFGELRALDRSLLALAVENSNAKAQRLLSRRNTDVRSLAVSPGNKRRLTAACDATLVALQDALAKRGFRATR